MVPAVNSPASGSAYFAYNPTLRRLYYNLEHSIPGSIVTGAHLHLAAPGVFLVLCYCYVLFLFAPYHSSLYVGLIVAFLVQDKLDPLLLR
jgi:hypothetical protein